MIKIYYADSLEKEDILSRSISDNSAIETTVQAILDDVKTNGDAALLAYTEKFDGVKLQSLTVSKDEIDHALSITDPYLIDTMKMAAERIKKFHAAQCENDYIINQDNGIVLGQKITPIARVGLYVPGGTASYPSSVLMNAIPAKLAGVKNICITTPPSKDGSIAAPILVAASIAGVDIIYKVGGAQAVAALTYGTESITPVDKIVGPGNAYVAAAKRRVFGIVDIDMVAGPSEILVIADENCNPSYVAADMLSQAEHDRLAQAILITNSEALAKAVQQELEVQIEAAPRRDICRVSIDNYGKIIIADSIDKAIEISNMIAPEHLEICVDEPFRYLNAIKNAGSIFLGRNVPEALGDYFAGPNHTLPTNGTARFSSPLGVYDFQKRSSFIYYSDEALKEVGDRIVNFAEHEGLYAHANSVQIRLNK
ncbi:MAG: histidinol dehydrogenase [Christensenellaceae bacterium]|nr:histidinol dehydrogenase [Christensenellaceae bacterium]